MHCGPRFDKQKKARRDAGPRGLPIKRAYGALGGSGEAGAGAGAGAGGTAGGGAGFALAIVLLRAIPRLGPLDLPRIGEVSVDGTVVAFATGLLLVTTLLFGLWPAFHAARAGSVEGIRAAARTIAGGRMAQRSRRSLRRRFMCVPLQPVSL